MKYKTVIELVSEAENESEALDIAGEFLRNNIETGVQMRCTARPIRPRNFLCTSLIFGQKDRGPASRGIY